jgi:hypothetical protein
MRRLAIPYVFERSMNVERLVEKEQQATALQRPASVRSRTRNALLSSLACNYAGRVPLVLDGVSSGRRSIFHGCGVRRVT